VKREMLKEQRRRLLKLFLVAENLNHADADSAMGVVRDAVRELSFVCSALLQDAADRESEPEDVQNAEGFPEYSQEGVADWLRRKSVGTVVRDRDGDPWKRTTFLRWVSGQGGEYTGTAQTSEEIAHWGPFTDEPVKRTGPYKVGDVLETEEDMEAMEDRCGAILRDADGDVWCLYRNDPDSKIWGGWYCTHPNMTSKRDGLSADYLPYTILHLPNEK
jgi:hypothetical protein